MESIRILLVEDDARVAMLFVDLLEGAYYQVTRAPDGERAIHLVQEAQRYQTPFQIIITDLILPGASGLDVLQTARSQQPPADVILLTGFGSLSSAIDALRLGAYDYLLKPCRAAQLLACVASAVEQFQARQRQTQVLQHSKQHLDQSTPVLPLPTEAPGDRYLLEGRLCLDRLDYVAFFDNQQIALTPTEYALLYCLLEARGRVLSYQEIVYHTHGYATSNAEAQTLLKTHISHLRRKIDSSYLVNVRGVGYMLKSEQVCEVGA